MLPPTIRFIVRDWLSANHILLRSGDESVLIDTGYVGDAATTLSLVAAELGAAPLTRIVNTHGHSDHIGGNAQLSAHYACPISVPIGEAQAIASWDTKALLLDYAGQHAERFSY